MAFQNPDEQTIQHYLKTAKNVAVVGLSDNIERTSFQVTQVVQKHGYNIFPVNPKLAGQEILGEQVYARLQDIPVSIDIVDIFRRSEFLPDVADDFLETDAKVFWAQLGIENEEAAKKLQDAGRDDIIMDRCIKIELGKLDQKQ
ncbi:CoA-binding protein [Tetragenococcus muriaticus]|uniref:Succinyl-CoA synthetase n=2 Tax=Tetragenococcus muriaticus TaxID=64642 RepID=A0A091C3Q0_9ENTE|nr:CoA-binding protein [Tetragenococcus muriaticus]KFN90722.1 succinyl-CoA synthetase [Tetragenococcus muriaticus 3MR10-3]KFN91087.1 succinyl-CoA synthetase [Tetragenococcus muriaticus PMC-11-5]GMA46986.1 CoA-binding protein [Tetragenococcus muriaticus]